MTWKRSDMSRRSSWTKAEIRRARQTPLKPVLEAMGYRLQPIQKGNYRVIGLYMSVLCLVVNTTSLESKGQPLPTGWKSLLNPS